MQADTLLISASFFGYAKEVKACLERRGRKVLWFEDRPSIDTMTKTMIRLAPSLVAERSEAYFDSIIAQLPCQNIRDVFVIKGEALSVAAISRLRRALPRAHFTIYFWDSYRNMPPETRHKVDHFDQAFTFDPLDAKSDRRLSYRPLFFLPDFAALPECEKDIDVLFLGTIHTDRYAVLRRIEKVLPKELNLAKIMYFPSRYIYHFRRIFDTSFRRSSPSDFEFRPLDRTEIISLIARARILIDIERPIQSGYTMRTIEALGAGKKLVTTNRLVAEADFYNPNNILIVDRRRPVLSEAFLSAAFEVPPANVSYRYSLEGFVDEIFLQSARLRSGQKVSARVDPPKQAHVAKAPIEIAQ